MISIAGSSPASGSQNFSLNSIYCALYCRRILDQFLFVILEMFNFYLRINDRVFEFSMPYFFWARHRSRLNLFETTQNLAAMRTRAESVSRRPDGCGPWANELEKRRLRQITLLDIICCNSYRTSATIFYVFPYVCTFACE